MSSDRVSGEGQGQECCRRGGVEAVAGTGILGTDQAGPEKQVGLAPPCKSSVLSRGKGVRDLLRAGGCESYNDLGMDHWSV